MTDTLNPQIELAFDYVMYTNRNIFLTGKAGTGKTTFLHRIKEESIKRTVVVAPTGVAAINARGMTIHSFFQLPFGPFLPGQKDDLSRKRKFRRKKINLIRNLDLLIIDEVSMVRADLLDSIDSVLRRFKNPMKPFGGVQLLMIGDLHQLPPVVKDEEWRLLNEYYDTPYFFGSLALKQTDPISVELKHIYRQSDSIFIDLLNRVRDNALDTEVLQKLNSRYIPKFKAPENEPYITLTSHNASANKINAEKLAEITGIVHKFKAEVTGDFPPHIYPTEEILEFKEGSQVLFIKNDPSPEKQFYNGKIGRITEIDGGVIYVKCPGDYQPIAVGKSEWTNVKYNLNEETKEVEEDEVGTFEQYPLKLAWAITIHKSQGLTFERAVIDAKAAFAHGQVYVALSRCKSFEGIVLRSKINYSSVKTDSVVRNYSENAEKNAPDEKDLLKSKKKYQQDMIQELFDFQSVMRYFKRVERVYLENENTLTTKALNQLRELMIKTESDIFSNARKFAPQLESYFFETVLPEKNEKLQARIQKASVWFIPQLKNTILAELNKIPVLTDNKAVAKKATDSLKNLEKEVFAKKLSFEAVQKGFSIQKYIKAKSGADMDFEKADRKNAAVKEFAKVPKNTPNAELYAQLIQWRKDTSRDLGVVAYEVLPTRTLLELAEYLPTGTAELRRIKGIGPARIGRFGSEIIEIIQDYCEENDIPANLMSVKAHKKVRKGDTKTISFDMFKSGKTIDEIAKERGFVQTTIEGHLGHFVALGKLDVYDLMDSEKVDEIEAFFVEKKTMSSSVAKDHFGAKYSYGELKMVLNHLKGKETSD